MCINVYYIWNMLNSCQKQRKNSQIEGMADGSKVHLILYFPACTDLQSLKHKMQESHPYIQSITVNSNDSLLLAFDNMSDLLEMQNGRIYSPIRTQIQTSFIWNGIIQKSLNNNPTQIYHSQIQSIQCSPIQISPNIRITQAQLQCQKQLFEFKLQECDNKSLRDLDQSDQCPIRCRRLTSLEDIVVEEEHIHKHFALFSEDDDANSTLQHTAATSTKIQDFKIEEMDGSPAKTKEFVWRPIVEGVMLTSLLYGGFKAVKYFLKQ